MTIIKNKTFNLKIETNLPIFIKLRTLLSSTLYAVHCAVITMQLFRRMQEAKGSKNTLNRFGRGWI